MEGWVLGIDSHAGSLTAVRVDALGRAQGQVTVPNTAVGHARLVGWAEAEAGLRRWAVEGAGGYGRALTRHLQARGERVAGVPGWLTARERRRGRRADKSDPQDALAAGRALLREPELPEAAGEDAATVLQLLSDERDALLGERTRLVNRAQTQLGLLGAEVKAAVGSLRTSAGVRRALALSVTAPCDVAGWRQRLVHRLALQLQALESQLAAVTADLETVLAQVGTSLTAQPGCQAITAARLLAETGDPARFGKGEAAYGRYSGTAPREASSGEHTRHRLDRRGNRALNAALHRMAVTQERMPSSPGHAYTTRRRQQGKTAREARRALKRHLANVVFRTIQRDIASGRTTLALT